MARHPRPAWRHVYRWDLDKTYLDTHFEELKSLVRIPFERAEHKVNVPGSASLLRELAAAHEGLGPSRVTIISGSPRQMRGVLEEKLRLDGVSWHEFHLKPQLRNIRQGRFRALREQVGYKLPLLLRSRFELGVSVGETLFGDDAEDDAFVYSLYADILAGQVDEALLIAVLETAGSDRESVERCLKWREQVVQSKECSGGEGVESIFIHLDRSSPPSVFAPFGLRLVPVFNYFQAALVLFARGHLDAASVMNVTRAFLKADQKPADQLANLFQDVMRRGYLPTSAMQDLGMAVQERADSVSEAEVVWKCVERAGDLGNARVVGLSTSTEPLDYVGLLERLRARSGR
ncbi:MAG TPA: hypothetical protein DIU15_15460 [Deltaproteobacteria bacterium]|nr:hypothetical protein [Deltaproteobacteria bacterium]HCP47438.1 hypothetical protein [Deltaproteobacteria bacterium]